MCSLCSRQPAHRNKMSLPTLRERAWCKVDRLFRRRCHNCPPQPQGEDRRNKSGGCTAFANAFRTTRSTLFSKFALPTFPHWTQRDQHFVAASNGKFSVFLRKSDRARHSRCSAS